MTIAPDQIGVFKNNWHIQVIQQWITQNNIPYTVDEIWTIREKCIRQLEKASSR